MSSPPQPLEKPFFNATIRQARLEVFKVQVSKRDDSHLINSNYSDYDSDYESDSGSSKDLYKATEDPEKFRGRIFIGNKYFFQEMYNSKKMESFYIDLPLHLSKKLKFWINSSSENEKEYLPMIGPETGIMVKDDFQVIVHPFADNVDADEKYEDAARARYVNPLYGFIPTDYVQYCRLPGPEIFDTPFEIKVGTACHLVKLNCVVHGHSKAVHLEVKLLKEDATTNHMYICGQVYVTSPAFPCNESYLFNTPPNKAVKAQLGKPITLLRSVVALPYYNKFVVKARLRYSTSIAEEFRFLPLVDDKVEFPFVDEDKDAVDSKFFPSHPFPPHTSPWRDLYCPVAYESKKRIHGIGGLLEVTAKVDVK